MEQIYIISDVHGCYKTLLALINQFPNKQNSKIVFVGDLIDKGKNTHDVIEFVKIIKQSMKIYLVIYKLTTIILMIIKNVENFD